MIYSTKKIIRTHGTSYCVLFFYYVTVVLFCFFLLVWQKLTKVGQCRQVRSPNNATQKTTKKDTDQDPHWNTFMLAVTKMANHTQGKSPCKEKWQQKVYNFEFLTEYFYFSANDMLRGKHSCEYPYIFRLAF